MATILINGVSAKAGGGKSILKNFLSVLYESSIPHRFVVVVPESSYSSFEKENIWIIPVVNPSLSLFGFYFSTIRRIVRQYKVSLIFNLADMIIPISIKQIYLFDWPYAIYPESVAWKRMGAKQRLFRTFKRFTIKSMIRKPVLLIAQTQVAEERLKHLYAIKNVEVVSNAVSLDNLSGGEKRDFKLPPGRIKLLYLTKYYTHKNIEIFITLSHIIRRHNHPYCIITTVSETQGADAARFLESIKKERLQDIIINVGPVNMEHVPSLYSQTDALLMPSLLESFSGTYVEAMFHGKPIFTSDLDFARVVCGDAAFYFDPLNAQSIIDTIKNAFNDPDSIIHRVRLGAERLKGFLSWRQAFERYLELIDKCLITDKL